MLQSLSALARHSLQQSQQPQQSHLQQSHSQLQQPHSFKQSQLAKAVTAMIGKHKHSYRSSQRLCRLPASPSLRFLFGFGFSGCGNISISRAMTVDCGDMMMVRGPRWINDLMNILDY